MEPLKLFYPNDYYFHAQRLGIKEEFNWALCGKKVWDPAGWHYLEVSPYARFFGTQTGQTFLVKGKPKLLIQKGLKSPKALTEKVKARDLDGVVIIRSGTTCKFPFCQADFVFLPGHIEAALRGCPLIKFVKRNNFQLRSQNPHIPTCQEIDRLLKNHSRSHVCGILYTQLGK